MKYPSTSALSKEFAITKCRPRRQKGMALFMVMSSLAILSVVVAGLTYSTQMHQRLTYNFLDGLRAYYMAKAGVRIGLLRLNAYFQVKSLLGDSQNKALSQMIDASIVEKIWNIPLIFPLPVAPEATPLQKDAIEKFNKESSLRGGFQLMLSSESSRFNLNQLLIKQMINTDTNTNTRTGTGTGTNTGTNTGTSTSTNTSTDVDIRPQIEEAINQQLSRQKEQDRLFAETYRNLSGKDIVDAIFYYIQPDASLNIQRPNLPGSELIKPKGAPLYSINELHYIHGIDDKLFQLISPQFTVFATPGLNINTVSKNVLWSVLPGVKEDEINEIMKLRDDPLEGKLFESEEKFWEAVKKTSLANQVDKLKENLQKAGIKLITSEGSFLIRVTATSGMASRTIEAYILKGKKPQSNAASQSQAGPPGSTTGQIQPTTVNDQSASSNQRDELQLLYWRSF